MAVYEAFDILRTGSGCLLLKLLHIIIQFLTAIGNTIGPFEIELVILEKLLLQTIQN